MSLWKKIREYGAQIFMSDIISNHNQFKEAVQSAVNEAIKPLGKKLEIVGGKLQVVDDSGNINILTDPVRVEISDIAIDPTPDPSDEIPDDVNIIYISNEGDDTNDGLTPDTAIATPERSKAVAYALREANSSAKLAFLFRCGDIFTPFGFLIAYRDGFNKPSLGMNGTSEWSTLFSGYGDGPNPEFRGDGTVTCFRSNGGTSYTEFRNLTVRNTGAAIGLLGANGNIVVKNCHFEAAGISVQGTADKIVSSLQVIDTVIWNCLKTGTAHSSGIFVNYCDGILLKNVVLYRNGWKGSITWDGNNLVTTPDAELGDDIFSHGFYGQYTCGPIRCEGVIAIFNAGAGLQMRSGGDLLDSFIAYNGQTGVVWGGPYVNHTLSSGNILRNVIVNHFAGALIVNGCESGSIQDNLIINGTDDLGEGKQTKGPLRYSTFVSGEHGTTSKDDIRFGVNNLDFINNEITGEIFANFDGWGNIKNYFPEHDTPLFGIRYIANKLTHTFTYEERERAEKFADPLGMYIINDIVAQEGQTVQFNLPVRDDTMLKAFLDQTLNASKLIEQTKV